ncbi:MAG: sugar ABC transporter permease [Proteobacteria bacterium]|nr:sugar ABC transporter permease [Pseudomonadota bacterium]
MARTRSPLLYVFLAVPVAYLLAFIGFPIVFNVTMSFQEVTIGNLAMFFRPFVGLDNYREVIADPTFRKVLINSLIFVFANVVGQISIGLCVALFFAENFAGAHYLRGLLLSAWMLPGLVVGALWKWMYATDYGVANYVLAKLRIVNGPVHWLSDPAMGLTAVNIAHIWYIMPFSMILIAAGLTTIPQEQYEAAALDGAGAVRRFRHVTLPALSPTLLAVACLVTIYSMRAFDMIVSLTHGGPLDSTNVLPLLSYQFSFEQFQFGVGAAIGTFAFILVIVVALVYVRTLNKEVSL